MKDFHSENDYPLFIFLEKIKAMFIAIIEKERITNDSKINLSNSLNSNLMDFFKEIDSSEKGYVDVKDLTKYINNHSITFNELTIRRFIHQFDKHKKFHLIYEDFCNIFNPYNQYSDNINIMNNDLTSEDIFLNILIDSFELIEQINEMTIDIRNTNNFTSYEAFMGITKGNKYLDEEFMTHFLEHNYDGEDIKHLIYIIDLNNDLLISYEEFQDFFIPLIKYTEEININNNYYDEIKQNQKEEEEINAYDSKDYNYLDNNYAEKNENDIVNYEKSGKNFYNKGKKGNNGNNSNSLFYISDNNNNYYNSVNQNIKNKVIPNNTIKLEKRNNDYNQCIDCKDKYSNSMNDLNFNKYKFNNFNQNQEDNNLKDSQEEEKNENYNKNENISNNNDNDNNNFEIDIDNDYDEYCNFFRKTQKFLSSSKKNDDYKSHSLNNIQKTPDFKNKQLSDKINENEVHNFNDNQKVFNQKYGNGNKNKAYNNINNDNDYILNIIDDNNIRENKKYNSLNINHIEVQYIPKNKNGNNLRIEKKEDINLNKDNDDSQKNNYDSIKKDDNKININNFTCGGINESEKGSSSKKKMNLSNNNNNNESYSLSNENNKISKNINISNTHSNSHNYNNYNYDLEDNNKVLDSFSDRIYKENLNKKLKEKEKDNNNINNTSTINFIKYIQFIVKNEKKTIDIKDKLCLREDISLKDLFFIFDYNEKNNISKNEFKVVCKKIFGLYPTSDQIVLVFKRYDKNKDDNLNLSEFLGMIKPIKQEYTSFLFNKKNHANGKLGYQQLSMKSKKLLVEVVKNIIEDEGNYYKFKDDMINQNLFDLKELWENLNKYLNDNKGLDKLEMKRLLTDNGISLSQYDLDILFNKLDYDNDQIISYEDFTEEFINYY